VSSERRLSLTEARACAERAAQLLALHPRVRLVYLFGSSTRPGAGVTGGAVRDVDLAVSTDPPLSVEELVKLRSELLERARCPIDLVSLDHASIVLAHEVVEGGVCLFARSPEVETEFVTRSRARFWDWRPYREEQWRLAGERLEERRRGG
jgi:predicted nucleotidyltransferase